MPFCVYQVTASNNRVVYYGYCTNIENPKAAFLTQAQRPEPDRVDVQFLDKCGGEDNISAKVIEVFETEIEAFITRNDYRSKDPKSVSGPSVFPPLVFQRAAKITPEKAEMWKQQAAAYNAQTALSAYQRGIAFSFIKIKTLADRYGKDVIMADLAALTYSEFRERYHVV
jgi:hypothetical protein